MNPVGSCMICGKQEEFHTWLDPKLISSGYYPYHGICYSCVEAAETKECEICHCINGHYSGCPNCPPLPAPPPQVTEEKE